MSIARWVDRVAGLAAAIASFTLAVIVLLITGDAAGRYLFSSPIEGVHAIVGGLLQPMMIFLGCALVARRDAHMRVEVVPLSRWPQLQRAVAAAFAFLIGAFWAVVAWQAAARAHRAWVLNQWPVGEIAVPAVISYSIVAFGALLALVAHWAPPSAGGAHRG
jgi:TRAP-type C4-dicarboxylate transport system permease small subunit